jgi:hypothetical protein
LLRLCAAFLLSVAGLSAAQAQAVVTLYGGARGGGEFSDENDVDTTFKLDNGAAVSASVDWNLADGRQAQVFYSFQRTALPGAAFGQTDDVDLDVSYLHVGGRVFFDGSVATGGGYVVGGLGITYFSPGLGGYSNELRPSMNVGVGYEWMLATKVSLRTELRGYVTLIDSSGGFFCSGGCVVAIGGDAMVQAEAMVGLSFAF